MNPQNKFFEDFQRNISDLIANSPAADIERNMKAMVAQAFAKMDLITRDEFEIQKQLLEKALIRIGELEQKIKEQQQE